MRSAGGLILLIAITVQSGPLMARDFWDWSDLESEDRTFYGSEKDKRFPIRAVFWTVEDWPGHYTNEIFWLFQYRDYPLYSRNYLLPLYHYKKSKKDDRYQWVIPPILTMQRQDSSVTRTINPLFYHRSDDTNNSATTSLAYLIWLDRYKSGHEFTIFPLYHHESSQDYFDLVIFPLLWYDRYDGKGQIRSPLYYETDEGSVLVPFLPFLYYGSDDHTQLATFIYWGSSYNSNSTDYAGLIPLFMWSDDEYFHLPALLSYNDYEDETLSYSPLHYYNEYSGSFGLPLIPFLFYNSPNRTQVATLIYWGNNGAVRKDKRYSYSGFFPLYMYEEDSYFHLPVLLNYNSYEDGFTYTFSPLHFYDEEDETIALPLLPVIYYQSTNAEGTHYNTLILADWNVSHDSAKGLDRFYFNPVYYWEEDSLLFVVPLYFNSEDEDETYTFGPLYYFYEDKTSVKPVYTSWAGLYYSHRDEYESRTYGLPLFYSWDTSNQKTDDKGQIDYGDGSIGYFFIPLFFNYSDASKNYHLNASGISYETAIGPLSASLTQGTGENVYYVDTDVSWFYNLFSYSSRTSYYGTAGEFGEQKEGGRIFDPLFADTKNTNQPDRNSEETEIAQTKRSGREDSVHYTSYSALFGIFQNEKADADRHVRVLPLFWLSWNEKNDDDVYVVPGAFIHYEEEQTEYNVIFPAFIPVYASQRTPQQSLDSYLLFLYLREENKTEERIEHSVLWPFYNSSKSPKRESTRLIPVYYSKTETYGDYKDSMVLSPLYINFKSVSVSQTGKQNESSFYPLPFLYTSRYNSGADEESYYNWLLLFNLSSSKEKGFESFSFFPLLWYEEDSYFVFFPLYWNESYSDGSSETYTPVGFWSNDSYEDEWMLGPVYSSDSKSDGEDSFHVMPFYFSWKSENYSSFFLLGYFSQSGPDSSYNGVPLILTHERNQSGSETSALLGLYNRENNKNKTSTSVAYRLLYGSKTADQYSNFNVGPFYSETGKDSYEQWLLPVYMYDRYKDSTELTLPLLLSQFERNNYSNRDYVLFGLLYYSDREPDINAVDYEYRFLTGLLYWQKRNDYRFENGSLWGLLWSYDSGDDYYDFTSYGLLSWSEKNKYHSDNAALLGLLFYDYDSFEKYHRTQLILGGIGYMHLKRQENEYSEYGSLWGILWNYQKEQKTGFRSFSIGKFLFSYTNYGDHKRIRIFGVGIPID